VKVAYIITAYNSWHRLHLTLQGVARLRRPPDELIIADDGSTQETVEHIGAFLKSFQGCTTRHVWHEDNGYRRSKILNRAIASTDCDLLVFSDGDCVPHPRFIEDHATLNRPGCFLAGGRNYVAEDHINAFTGTRANRIRGILAGWVYPKKSSLRLPLVSRWNSGCLVSGCNLAFWRADMEKLNGYDESFEGWGFEDRDVVARALNLGLEMIRYYQRCLLFHLEHPIIDRARAEANERLFEQRAADGTVRAAVGLDQYLPAARPQA
jgi:glycosyltransferase involved in cell wall biosynthesis